MNQLKKLIVKYFVLCAFGISVAESVIDSTFADLLMPAYADHETVGYLLVTWHLVLCILVFFLGAYLFYGLTKKAMEAESKRQMQEQNLLYSCIAHDLKTPMTSVQGFASALKDGKIKPEEQEEVLDIIYRKSRHMNDLIETLSAYSKLGTESYVLETKAVNLCTLVRDLAAMHYSEFEDRHMELQIEIPDAPIICQLDEKEFQRAVNNLIVNAYKHNREGTGVLIKVQSENGTAIVTVADQGEKIPQEFAKNMFKPFVCGNSSRTSGNGSGLGLAISGMIVEKHGGRLYMKEDIDDYAKGFVVKIRTE